MRILGVALLLVALAMTSGCGSALPSDGGTRDAAFQTRAVTWAQGSTIHYGSETYTVPGGGRIEQLWWSPYGFVVRVRPRGDPEYRASYVFVDEHGTSDIGGSPDTVRISPDGRYAGWIDRDGPRRMLGRLAEAVVVDLRTGRELMRDHHDMGGATDDLAALYGDAGVAFLGFDDTHAYWLSAKGDPQIKRARIGRWEVEPGGREGDLGETPIGKPYDALSGRMTGMADDGREAPHGEGTAGLVSPDGRWCLTPRRSGTLGVVDCRTGRDATPRYPARWAFFGGWQGPDTLYVLARRHYDHTIRQGADDTSRGVLATCSLRTGRCRTIESVRRTDSIVFATGDPTHEI